jgi:transposase
MEIEVFLKTAIILGKIREDIAPESFQKALKSLKINTTTLLASTKNIECEEYVANRLRKQADHIFTFLDMEGIDPTNNLAEQQLRPAIITRKVSCGNRSVQGANSWQEICSLIITAKQQGKSFLDMLRDAFFHSNRSINFAK